MADYGDGGPVIDSTQSTRKIYDYSSMGFNTNGNVSINLSSKLGRSCADFNGIDQYIETPNITLGKSFTICVWVYLNEAKNQFIIDQRNQNGIGYQPIYINAEGDIQYYNSAVGNNSYFSTGLQPGQWYHVAIAKDTNIVRCYVNGEFKDSKTDSAFVSDAPLTIGCRYTNVNYFNGKLDDLKIYSSCLTADQIKKEYKNRAYIDNGNKMFCKWIEEVDNGQIISEKGVVNTPCIVENQYYRTSDGVIFLKIFSHDIRSKSELFVAKNSSQSDVGFVVRSSNRFSRLEDIPLFKASNGKFEFLLRYPDLSATQYNRWRQTANPLNTQADASQTVASMGYEAVEISWSTSWMYGMGLSTSATAYLDCQAGHSNWYGAIGQSALWEGGFPASDGSCQKFVELYVRVDNIKNYKAVSIRDNKAVFTDEFIEI